MADSPFNTAAQDDKKAPLAYRGAKHVSHFIKFLEKEVGLDLTAALEEKYPAYTEKHKIEEVFEKFRTAVKTVNPGNVGRFAASYFTDPASFKDVVCCFISISCAELVHRSQPNWLKGRNLSLTQPSTPSLSSCIQS